MRGVRVSWCQFKVARMLGLVVAGTGAVRPIGCWKSLNYQCNGLKIRR